LGSEIRQFDSGGGMKREIRIQNQEEALD